MANNDTVNAKTMALQGNTLINRGTFAAAETITLRITSVDNTDGHIHAGGTVTGTMGQLQNQRGSLSGVQGTNLTLENALANQDGEIGAGGTTELHFTKSLTVEALGLIRGETTQIEAPSDRDPLTLKNGKVAGQALAHVGTHILKAPGVNFVTPRLELDVADFNLDPQGAVDRTIVQRRSDQNFKLTHPYKSTSTLEFWQQGLADEEAVKAAMLARFGDGSGDLPVAEQTIELQANIQIAKGLQFYMPAAKLRIGDNDVESFVELDLSHTRLTAYLSQFDLEKGSIAALSAFVHAPLGNTLGRLVRDKTRDMLATFFWHGQSSHSHNIGGDIAISPSGYTSLGRTWSGVYDEYHLLTLPMAVSNNSQFYIKGITKFKGPLIHHGHLTTKDLIIDSPKDSECEAGSIKVNRDFTLKGRSNFYLKRHIGYLDLIHYGYPCGRVGKEDHYQFAASGPADCRVDGTLSALRGFKIINEGSILYWHQKPAQTTVESKDFVASLYQKVFGINAEERSLSDAPFSWNYTNYLYQRYASFIGHRPLTRAIGFVYHTNNFAGAQKVFPAVTSSSESVVLPADGTMLEGNFTAPLMLIPVDKGGLILGSRNPYYIPKQASVRDLLAKGFNLNTTYITDNLRELIEAEASPQFHFKIRERFWFNATKAQQFYQDIQDHVVVRNKDGLFRRPQPNAIFSLSPKLLLETVQEQCQETLMRGYIYEQDGQRVIDMDLLKHLHRNTTAYLEQIGFNSDNFAQALVTRGSKPQFPLPSEPMIYYLSTSNEQELEELRPWVYFPEAMIDEARGKRGGKIRTHVLAIIEAGMLPREMIDALQDPRMQQAAIKFFDNHPDVARLITERADEYWRLKALEEAPKRKYLTNAETDTAANPIFRPLQVRPDQEEQEESQEGRVEIVSQSAKNLEGPGELQDYATYAVDFGEAAADPGRGVHGAYTVHPTPGDGNCFFHAAFTQPGDTRAQVTARAAQIRNSIPDLIRNNPAYLDMLRPEVLAGINQAFTTYEVRWGRAEQMPKPPRPDYISAQLWDMAYDNYVYRYQREAAIAADKEARSQADYGKSFAALTPEQKNGINNAAQVPAAFLARERYRTDEFLAAIEDDVVLTYAQIYTDPTTFIEVPPTRSEKNSSGHLIALDQGIRINQFCFRADTGKLTYNGFVGQADSSHIVNVLFKDSHFWRLVNEDQENPDRTLAVRQTEQNDSNEPSSLAPLADSTKAVERPNQSVRTASPSGPVTLHGEQSLGALFVGVNDTVKSTADITSDRGFVMSFDKDVIIQSETSRVGNGENFQDVVSTQARIGIKKDPLYIYGGRNVLFQGAETYSKSGTYIAALVDVYDIPLELVSQQTIHHYGKYKGIEQLTHINNHVSKHSSGATIDIAAGRAIMSYAAQYNAKKGRMYAIDDIQLTDVTNKRLHFLNVSKKGGTFSKSKNIQEQSCTQTSQGGVFNFSDGFDITVAQGAPTLTNPTLNCPLTVINAPHGTPRLNLGVNTHQSSSVTSSSNAAWQKQRCEQQNHVSYSVPRINGILEINAQGAIAQAIQGQTLEYLDQIKLNGGKLTQEILHELHEVDVKKIQGPSAALSIIISIAAGIATSGAGASIGGALTGTLGLQGLSATVVSGMVQAATSSLIAQAALSCATHQGDLGKVAKDLSSRQNLRALRNAMVKAALLGTGGSAPDSLSFAELVLVHASQAIPEAGLDMVLEKTKPKEALISALQNTIVKSVGEYGARHIRAAYKPTDPNQVAQLNYLTHKLAHMGLAAPLGAVLNPDNHWEGAIDGAAGALIGEVLGEAFSDTFLEGVNLSPDEYARRRELGIQLAKLGAATGALAFNRNPHTMVTTAENAAAHNALGWVLELFDALQRGERFLEAIENNDIEAINELCQSQREQNDRLKLLFMTAGTGTLVTNAARGMQWLSPCVQQFANARLVGQLSGGLSQGNTLLNLISSPYRNAALEAGMAWGRAMPRQGLALENYLSPVGAASSRVPAYGSTFELYNSLIQGTIRTQVIHGVTQAEIQGPILETFPIHKDEQPHGWITPRPEPRGPEILSTPMSEIMGPTILGTPIAEPSPPLPGFGQADPESLRDGWIFRSEHIGFYNLNSRQETSINFTKEKSADVSKPFKTGNFQKNDNIGLDRFTKRLKRGGLQDPKTKQVIMPELAKNSGSKGHGGSYWKLFDSKGNRIGTISKDGRWLRK